MGSFSSLSSTDIFTLFNDSVKSPRLKWVQQTSVTIPTWTNNSPKVNNGYEQLPLSCCTGRWNFWSKGNESHLHIVSLDCKVILSWLQSILGEIAVHTWVLTMLDIVKKRLEWNAEYNNGAGKLSLSFNFLLHTIILVADSCWLVYIAEVARTRLGEPFYVSRAFF